jgi:hypothetical protein
VIARSGEWRCLDVSQTETLADPAQTIKLFGSPIAGYREMVSARTEILADSDDRHAYALQVGHGSHDLLLSLAKANHKAGLRDKTGLPGTSEHA